MDSQKEENSGKMETDYNNIEELQKARAEEKSKSEANLAGWQRAQADFANYKRHAEQEKADTCKFANANLLCTILPVLDDFERALAAIPPEESSNKWVEARVDRPQIPGHSGEARC
jgi:molecular chaperone GrpE